MLEKIKAAIFDMDGTIVDSMWVWHKIDRDFLYKRGFNIPDNLKESIEHLSFLDTAKYFKETFRLPDSVQEIMDEWNNMAFNEYSNNVTLKAGAYDFLEHLKSRGIKIALATSNCDMLLKEALRKNDIEKFFDCITTVDEVDRGKSFPDIYLLTADKLNVKPEECIVFEDILPAVKGAKAAGMKVVGVHDYYSEYQKQDIIDVADRYIERFNELIEAI